VLKPKAQPPCVGVCKQTCMTTAESTSKHVPVDMGIDPVQCNYAHRRSRHLSHTWLAHNALSSLLDAPSKAMQTTSRVQPTHNVSNHVNMQPSCLVLKQRRPQQTCRPTQTKVTATCDALCSWKHTHVCQNKYFEVLLVTHIAAHFANANKSFSGVAYPPGMLAQRWGSQ
jgi:hypothetical protein